MAIEWYRKCCDLNSSNQTGEQPPLLVLLYCLFSLESFISEQLYDRQEWAEYHHLYNPNISLAQRWKESIKLIKSSTSRANKAAEMIFSACNDGGILGLLARARNQLMHPLMTIEIGNLSSGSISNDKIENLIREVRKPPVSLPYFSAAFPGMLMCTDSAVWSLRTLATMIRLFFDAVSEDLPEEWSKLLSDYEVYHFDELFQNETL